MKNNKFLTMCATASLAVGLSMGAQAASSNEDMSNNNPACMIMINGEDGPLFVNVNYIRDIKVTNGIRVKMASNHSNTNFYDLQLDKKSDIMKEAENLADKINDCATNARAKRGMKK